MKKIKLIYLIILLLILIGLAACGGYYLIIERNNLNKKIDELSNEVDTLKTSSISNTQTNSSNTLPKEEKSANTTNTNSVSNTNTSKYIAKIDNQKDYVYDAQYPTDNYDESFTNNYPKAGPETYKLTDFVIPYINIDSADAKKANEELKKVYYENIVAFDKRNKSEFREVESEFCTYQYFINDNILSVVVSCGIEGVASNTDFKTYNFDLETGKLMNYEEVYQATGYTKDSLREKVITTTRKVLIDKYELDKVDSGEKKVADGFPQTLNEFIDESMKKYDKDVDDGKMMNYIGENGKLFIVLHVSVPFDGGGMLTVAEIE